MPDITFPNTFTTLTAVDADAVAENIYEPRSTPRTLSVINGRLSEANLKKASPLSREEVRRGSFVAAEPSRGATANLDYFDDFWVGDGTLAGEFATGKRSLVIPGASKSFFNPWTNPRGIYISWHLSTVIEHKTRTGREYGGSGTALVSLFINGVKVTGVDRRVSSGRFMMVDRVAPTDTYNATRCYPDVRHWSGHWIIDTTNLWDSAYQGGFSADKTPLVRGYHNASIRLAHIDKHARVRSRHMTVLPIR